MSVAEEFEAWFLARLSAGWASTPVASMSAELGFDLDGPAAWEIAEAVCQRGRVLLAVQVVEGCGLEWRWALSPSASFVGFGERPDGSVLTPFDSHDAFMASLNATSPPSYSCSRCGNLAVGRLKVPSRTWFGSSSVPVCREHAEEAVD